jgi:hypothetical protein
MGKTRIIAETGAGQHGVATATVAARFGLPCTIFMGARDVERQAPNVFRMKLLGAEVVPVTSALADAEGRDERGAARLGANVHDTFYIIGTAAGPHPYPELVRDFQSVIGTEARAQMLERKAACPTCWLRPSAADRTRSACSIPSSMMPVEDGGRRSRGHGSTPGNMPPAWPADARRAARQQDLSAAGRGRPDHRRPLDLGRARLSRHRPGTCLAARIGRVRI